MSTLQKSSMSSLWEEGEGVCLGTAGGCRTVICKTYQAGVTHQCSKKYKF